MNSIKTLYKLMEVSSRDLEIPDAYQRKLNTERVATVSYTHLTLPTN